MIHHCNKGDRGQFSGSNAIQGAVDTLLVLQGDIGKYQSLGYKKCRTGITYQGQTHRVKFNQSLNGWEHYGSVNPSQMKWDEQYGYVLQIDGTNEDQVKPNVHQSCYDTVKDYLENLSGIEDSYYSLQQIASNLDFSEDSIRKAVKTLEDENKLDVKSKNPKTVKWKTDDVESAQGDLNVACPNDLSMQFGYSAPDGKP